MRELWERSRWLVGGALVAGAAAFALATWGGMFEQRRWAVPLELARLALLWALVAKLPLADARPWALGLTGVYVLGSALALGIAWSRRRTLARPPVHASEAS